MKYKKHKLNIVEELPNDFALVQDVYDDDDVVKYIWELYKKTGEDEYEFVDYVPISPYKYDKDVLQAEVDRIVNRANNS